MEDMAIAQDESGIISNAGSAQNAPVIAGAIEMYEESRECD
jgi:hypothetical protein